MVFKPIFNINSYINWQTLSINTNPIAISILEKNLDKVNWEFLSANPNAISILEENLDKVNWHWLSENPNAIHILENNIKVNWFSLSRNPNAIHIIENNLDKISWSGLSINPNAIHLLAPLNHDAMRKQIEPFRNELLEHVFRPSRLRRLSNKLSVDLGTLLTYYG